MEEEKVYVVECSSGSWDSFHSWIGGIFQNEEDAEYYKNKLNNRANEVKENCPVVYSDDLSIEDEKIYDRYFAMNQKEMEWKPAEVREYPFYKTKI